MKCKPLYFLGEDNVYSILKTYFYTTSFYMILQRYLYILYQCMLVYSIQWPLIRWNYCIVGLINWFIPSRNQSLSDLSSFEVVAWLYSPCAIRCKARLFFVPLAFLILALLFWNQILIWDSLRPSSCARLCRLCSVRYRFVWNSVFSLCSCSAVKAVLGRLSSLLAVFFFGFRDLGPVLGKKAFYKSNHIKFNVD